MTNASPDLRDATPVLRWRDPDDPGTLYRAATEEALVTEMRRQDHAAPADDAAYMALVAARTHALAGATIRTGSAVDFVVDLVHAGLLVACEVHPTPDGGSRIRDIPRAQYVATRIATLPRNTESASAPPSDPSREESR